MTDILGFAAAFLTTAAFLPQAVKVYRTKRTEDLSVGLFGLLFVGVFLWFIYGLMINSYPVIIANAVTLVLVGYILIVKIRS
ncbi:MAG: SemiSWEET transporter [Campylobacterales bacterium]|jgi:MtN3 and saliva related transmembrane protein|nr:SemiSWEET transporter [Campylobacterales bacterium]